MYTKTNAFLALMLIVGILFALLKDTTLFIDTLFEREGALYQPYLSDSFDEYSGNSEVLDSGSEDLSRWQNSGSITAFVDILDWSKVRQVDLRLTDAAGRTAVLTGIENILAPREENDLKSNDAFLDYDFSCDQPVRTWEDFMLVNGTNFLFWEYGSAPPIDMSNIVSWAAFDADGGEEFPLKDVVVHDGLCASKNSLAGKWHSPNGLPQYGVWWTEGGLLIMKKVDQTQYPSNGDHTRILSSAETPQNFLMRVRFSVSDMPKISWFSRRLGTTSPELLNTFLRVAWDFDDEYDPGHDQTLVYNSLEYGYLGLQRVFPIVRYFQQGYEPHQNYEEAKTKFVFKNGRTYEVQIQVEGQHALVEVYRIGKLFDTRTAALSYTFIEARPATPYPFSIEATGNIDIAVDEVEVRRK